MTERRSSKSGVASPTALVLGGGGARGAYQAGVLRAIARLLPGTRFPILAGISAGAVNTIHLAAHPGSFDDATGDLVRLWLSLTPDQVYEVRALPLLGNILRWARRLVSGAHLPRKEPMRALADTTPLRRFLERVLDVAPDGTLPGIASNISRGTLSVVTLSATSYTTGRGVSWVQGENVEPWERPMRRSEVARLTVDHVMASTALPVLFPAVRVGAEWYGDGGMRLIAPLSPAIHLGAARILTISTKYARTHAEAATPQTIGYPPPAQVLGVLYNSIFLDLVDEDVLRLERVNELARALPPDQRRGMRIVDVLVLRPSRDLGRLAAEFEPRLPPFFRYLTRGLGTLQTRSPDILSLVLFQVDYLRRLVELGEADAEAQIGAISAFLGGEAR